MRRTRPSDGIVRATIQIETACGFGRRGTLESARDLTRRARDIDRSRAADGCRRAGVVCIADLADLGIGTGVEGLQTGDLTVDLPGTESAVKPQLKSIFAKLGVSREAELAAMFAGALRP